MRRLSAFIVAGSSALQDGLLALVAAIPQIKVVGESANAVVAIRAVSKRCPDLVLLDTRLPDREAWMALTHIKSGCPRTRCIVVADRLEQRSEAEALGADIVLVKGTPADKVIEAIEGLLPRSEGETTDKWGDRA